MFWNWLKAGRNTTPVSVLDCDVYGPEPERLIYKRKPQPMSDIAGMYAKESFALVPFSPVGPATGVGYEYRPMPLNPPAYMGYNIGMYGMPTVAGQIVFQPLFDPDAPGAGFVAQNSQDVPPYEHYKVA